MLKIIKILVTVFSTFSLLNFNNPIHFDVCGMKNYASYIYLDSLEVLFGLVKNSYIAHFNYTLIENCNQSSRIQTVGTSKTIMTTKDNMVVTHLPYSTVTALPIVDAVMQNLTNDVMISGGKCTLQHYFLTVCSSSDIYNWISTATRHNI